MKKQYKQNSDFNLYKKFFSHKQMRFIFLKIYSIFSENISKLNIPYELEFKLIKEIENELMWQNCILELSLEFDHKFKNLDWKSFGSFLFYIYNVSEFYNKKSMIKNIYNYENFNDLNQIKSSKYNAWLKSLYNQKLSNFNNYVLQVLEIVK